MAPDQAKGPDERARKLPPRAPSFVKPTSMQKSKYRHLLANPCISSLFGV